MSESSMKVNSSIFGRDIDARCPGYSFLAKLGVVIGLNSDAEESERLGYVDEELDRPQNPELKKQLT